MRPFLVWTKCKSPSVLFYLSHFLLKFSFYSKHIWINNCLVNANIMSSFCISYIHKLLLRLKKYVTDDLLNNLLFGAVEITEIPNKLFIMCFMPVQLSCPAFFDSYRLRTLNQNMYQTKMSKEFNSQNFLCLVFLQDMKKFSINIKTYKKGWIAA